MKKLFLALLVLSTVLLSSCSLFGGDSGDPTPTPSGNDKITQIVVYDIGMDILDFRSKIYDLTGIIPVVSADETAAECEIVFGDTSRAITALAKAELAKLKSSKSGSDYGYIIYTDGKSVAIYWEHENLRDLAVNKFVSKCLDEQKLKLTAGSIDSALFTSADVEQSALWMALEASVTPEVYSALRKHANYINGSVMLEWMANLWDNELGGFYFSNSARDNEPFRPDIESTIQVINFFRSSGAVKSPNDALPHDIKLKIVDFVREMQSTDGYFYHPQWPQGTDKLQTDRYGRDLSSSMSIINMFTVDRDGDGVEEKQYPKYCAANGGKCEAHTKDGGSCSFASATVQSGTGLSKVNACASVSGSVSYLVSKMSDSVVKPTASVSDTPDFSSRENFKAWLEAYNTTIKENSGKAHNLEALLGVIKAHGYTDVVIEFLQRAQREVYEEQVANGETPSGLWQYKPDYNFAWGVHKYKSFYENAGVSFIYHKEIVASLVEVIKMDVDENSAYYLHDHMNQWIAITEVVSNARKHNPDVVPELYEIVRASAVDLIDISIEKLEPMNLGNGLFVYSYDGKSPTRMYGVPSSNGVREADVNGMFLLGNYYNSVFQALGYTSIPLCTSDDAEVFLDTVINAEPISKNPPPKAETLDFEDSKSMDRLTHGQKHAESYLEIVTDPKDSTNNVVAFYSPSSSTVEGDHLYLSADNSGGDCSILEFDIYVDASTTGTRFIQIVLGSSFMLELCVENNYLTANLASARANPINDFILKADAQIVAKGTWNRIRVEAFDPEDKASLPHLKLFVNEELIAESTCYFGKESGKAYNAYFDTIDIYSVMGSNMLIYLDNIYCSREIKAYVEDSDDISDMRDNQ